LLRKNKIIAPILNIKQLGIPKDFGPDIYYSTNRDPEVFRGIIRSKNLALRANFL